MKQLFKYVTVLMAVLIVIANSFVDTITAYLVRKENQK